MRAMDGICALGHRVQDQQLILFRLNAAARGEAKKYVKNRAIATQCGSGGRRPDTIPALLRIEGAAAE